MEMKWFLEQAVMFMSLLENIEQYDIPVLATRVSFEMGKSIVFGFVSFICVSQWVCTCEEIAAVLRRYLRRLRLQ